MFILFEYQRVKSTVIFLGLHNRTNVSVIRCDSSPATRCESLIAVVKSVHHTERSIQYEKAHNNILIKSVIESGDHIKPLAAHHSSICTPA